VKEKKKERK